MEEYVEALCSEYAARNNFSGVCMVKRKGETVFAKAYGYANRAFQIPNEIDTRFDAASITKIFTAAAVLQLIEQRKMRLQDRITELLDLSGTEIPDDVTVEHLLNHTSGIADDADEEAGEDYSALFADSPNYAIRECRDFLKNFAYKKPHYKAGTDVRYCNCSYVLLGLAIEQISGMNYRDYFRQNIFDRAGMARSGFFSMDEVNENTAEGYRSVTDQDGRVVSYKKNIYCYPPMGTPDGGAYTTAEDLNRFLTAIRDHVLLGEKFADMFLHPHCEFTRPMEGDEIPGLYEQNGYGFEFLMLEGSGEPFCICKDGMNDGVAAKFSYYPEKDMTLVLLANQECNVWEMTRKIQSELYRRYY
ncbi:MAG: serine hydrolase domain-containing protein [Lachnospiraceae bacterium]|nr:serine hydrolase domain-containing protein [Lachnospiraceae bacterium]